MITTCANPFWSRLFFLKSCLKITLQREIALLFGQNGIAKKLHILATRMSEIVKSNWSINNNTALRLIHFSWNSQNFCRKWFDLVVQRCKNHEASDFESEREARQTLLIFHKCSEKKLPLITRIFTYSQIYKWNSTNLKP